MRIGKVNSLTLGYQIFTRRERLKSALYPRLKKRNVFEIPPFGLFENPVCCKISKKKLKEGPFVDIKKFSKKKQNESFEQSHSAEKCKREPFGLFQHPSSCKKTQKSEGGDLFEDIKNFQKKSHKAEKRRGKSHSAKNWKEGTLLGFVFQFRGFWMRTEYFWWSTKSGTKSGTYRVSYLV